MSSLYALLNVDIPEHLNSYLNNLYKSINQDLLALFGVDISVAPLGDEKITYGKGKSFGVSSNVATNNSILFIFIAANIVVIAGMQKLCRKLAKENFLRKKIQHNYKELISFQIINIIAPVALPWTFCMLSMGVRNFRSKANAACYLVIYFLALVFPIYYFFELLQERSIALR
jgi:hypothetical protein